MTSLSHAALAYVRDLKDAGMPERQAEIQATFITDIIEDSLATKADLEKAKNELALKISESKNEMIKWFLGSVVVLAALIVASIRLVH